MLFKGRNKVGAIAKANGVCRLGDRGALENFRGFAYPSVGEIGVN